MEKIGRQIIVFLLLLISFGFLNLANALEGTIQYGGTLSIAWQADLTGTNPFIHTRNQDMAFLNLIYDRLVGLDEKLQWRPLLASNWSVSSDMKTWTFSLVTNATFHDGVALTARDVKFTFDTILTKANSSAYYTNIKSVQQIDIPDNYTVVFRLTAPDQRIMADTGLAGVKIVPEHLWKDIAEPTKATNDNPIGSGPWVFVERVADQYVKIRANLNYWGRRPYFDEITFKVIKVEEVRIQALMKGDIGALDISSPAYVALISKNLDLKVVSNLGSTIVWMPINARFYPLNIKEVRQAIAYAIDRADIVSTLFSGYAEIGDQGFLPPGIEFFKNANVTGYGYNVSKANQMLDALGFNLGSDGIRVTPNGTKLEFTLNVATNEAWRPRGAEMLANMLNKVGIKVNINALDYATYITEKHMYVADPPLDQDYQLLFETHAVDTFWICSLFSSVRSHARLGKNYLGYNSSTFNAYANEFAATLDPAAQQAAQFGLQAVLAEDVPAICVAYKNAISAYRPDQVEGWVMMLNGLGIADCQNTLSFGSIHAPIESEPIVETKEVIPPWVWVSVAVAVIAVIVSGSVLYFRRKK